MAAALAARVLLGALAAAPAAAQEQTLHVFNWNDYIETERELCVHRFLAQHVATVTQGRRRHRHVRLWHGAVKHRVRFGFRQNGVQFGSDDRR